jgi:surface antigen
MSNFNDFIHIDKDDEYYPWTAVIKDSYGLLQTGQKEQNAIAFYQFFIQNGYPITLEALAGILGNISIESQLNPGQIEAPSRYNKGWDEKRRGHGFIQWTGGSNGNNPLLNWCKDRSAKEGVTLDWHDLNVQCYRIICEGEGINGAGGTWIETRSYSYSWEDFCNITDVHEATKAYLYERERAGVAALQKRLDNADYWYTFLLDKGAVDAANFIPRTHNDDIIYNLPAYMSNTASTWWGGKGTNQCKARAAFNDYQGSGTFYRKSTGVYYTGHEQLENGSVLPNCTGYAWGRASEIMGEETPNNLSTSNACLWFLKDGKHGYGDDGYERSTTVPKLGAVICWAGTSANTAGHVGIVEQIIRNEAGELLSIKISESGYYGGFGYKNKEGTIVYYTISDIPANKLVVGAERFSSKFQGYIYLPVIGGDIAISPPIISKPKFIKIRDTEVEIALEVSSETSASAADKGKEFKFGYELFELVNNSRDGEASESGEIVPTLSDSGAYVFTIDNLKPNTDYAIHFSVCYPQNWICDRNDGMIMVSPPADSGSKASVSIHESIALAEEITAADYWEKSKVELYLLDEEKNLQPVSYQYFTSKHFSLILDMKIHNSFMIKVVEM